MVVELKSVNHRFLDINIRSPRSIAFIEDRLRTTLSENLSRGHVDIYIHYNNQRQDARQVVVDEALFSAYQGAVSFASQNSGMKNDIRLLEYLRMPDVMRIEEAEEDRDALCELASQAAQQACEELVAMRSTEGERLSNDLSHRIQTLITLHQIVREHAPSVVEEYRIKLQERVEQLLPESVALDEGRLVNEVAIMADRADISEELVRLNSHFKAFGELLAQDEAVGRKLDFLVQEMNREWNTIGSKANDSVITSAVVDAKAEMEKIREQIQNIE